MIGIFFALLYFEDLSVAPSLSRLFFEKYILILLLYCYSVLQYMHCFFPYFYD